MLFRYLCLLLAGLLLFGSIPLPVDADGPAAGEFSLQAAREALESRLANIPGFVGIAHSGGQITVFLENEAAKSIVSDSFNGFMVRKKVTGRFKALGYRAVEAPATGLPQQVVEAPPSSLPEQVLADPAPGRGVQVRPLEGGVSVFSSVSTEWYGTLGMVTYNNKILSNAHVLAMYPYTFNFVALGTAVIQPAGSPVSTVGALYRYVPIAFNNPSAQNYADAAIASIYGSVEASSGLQFGEGGDYLVSGTTEVALGDTVRKSGATSMVTQGTVTATNADVQVDYGSKKAYFKDQILVGPGTFSDDGDSGSCVDKGGKFVGLLFAGSGTDTVVCKASHIMEGLGISASSATSAAIFRQGGTWYIDADHNGRFQLGVDTFFGPFGATAGDIPLAIDWDGDGRQELAIFRTAGPDKGKWYIDLNHNGRFQPGVDTSFGPFGTTDGDIPLAIDWDGNGTQEAAIFRPATGTWYIDLNHSGRFGSGDVQYGPFGTAAGDAPVAIDWDGDGSQELCIFSTQGASRGYWFIDTNRNGTFQDGVDLQLGPFGTTDGDIPLALDWNGDDREETAIFRTQGANQGYWYIDTSHNGVYNSTRDISIGQFGATPGDRPLGIRGWQTE